MHFGPFWAFPGSPEGPSHAMEKGGSPSAPGAGSCLYGDVCNFLFLLIIRSDGELHDF